jgi:hypothetical protein
MVMRSSWIAAAVLVPLSFPFAGAAPERFAPEDHFPKECFFHAAIDVGKLGSGLAETPFGRMLAHPGMRKALAGLESLLVRESLAGSEEFMRVTGMHVLEFMALFEGEVAITVSGVDMHGPATVMSFELGSKRKEIEGAFQKLGSAFLGSMGGGEAQTTEVKGHQVTTWPAQFGPSLQYTVLGNTLVLGVGGALEAVIGRFEGEGGGSDALRYNPVFARAKLQASVASPLATLFVNWEAIRGVVTAMTAGTPDGEEMKRAFEAIGLDRLASVLYRVGIREGDLEGKLYIDSPGGLGGILGILASSFGPVEDAAALSRIPAGAIEIGAYSISTGQLIRGLHEKLKAGWADTAAAIDGLVSRLEGVTGLSLQSDLYLLPRLSLHSFSILPPAGGLLPDSISIVRTSEFQPYLVALDKFARKTGARVESLEIAGRGVAFFTMARIEERVGLAPPRIVSVRRGLGAGGDEETVHELMPWGGLFREGPSSSLTLALAPIDAEWMALSRTPQGISRYFSTYSKMPPALQEEAVAGLIKKEIGNEAGFSILRGGRHVLFLYNTALTIAMLQAPLLEKRLKALGVDLAQLPPGEDFQAAFRDGFLLFRPAKDGFLVHGHRALSNLIGSPTILSAIMEIGLAMEIEKELGDEVPSGPEARLRELGAAFKRYAETAGMGAYPHDPAGSLAALQKVVDAGLIEDASMLVHPVGGEKPARAAGGEAKVVLAEENVSYEIVPWKQGPTDSPSRILAHEKKPYGAGGRHVLFVDLRVELLEEAEFQRMHREQSERYGKPAKKEED